MKRIYKITFIVLALGAFLASCVKDLDTTPIDPDVLSPANVFNNPASIKQVLAKLYAGLATSGQQGAAGVPDIKGIDEGFGEYLRGFWYHQELTTDEAVIGWNDQTIKDFHYQTWGSNDVFIAAMYYRIFFQISQCNEFIRESTDSKLAGYGITDQATLTTIHYYVAEARFLRALSYFHALDMFGNVPFVTENDPVGKIFPKQISRTDLYNYVESELLDIQDLMMPPKTNEYGRADQAAAWTLLAKLYLNSEVYLGQNKYTECITYCNKVISTGYSLMPEYENLFLADNDQNNPEVILPINFDGLHTRTWGGTTFIIHAAIGGSMDPGAFGVAGGWGGTRTTSALVEKFPTTEMPAWHSKKPIKNTKRYPVIYVPGSYQGWNVANTFTVLASVANDGNYEGYLYFPEANTEFKFTPAPNWDTDWGDNGADGTLDVKGANIKAADPGYYKVNVDLNALTYTLTKTEWGLVGDATPGGWDTDTPMVYDTAAKVWTVTVDLTAAKIKFRANGAWDINYGDNGADGILEAGGTDIQVGAAGKYVVSMKLGCPDYTYTIAPYVPPSYDHRAMFWTDGQSLEINDIGSFTDGYAITKFKNVTSSGAAGADGTFCDTDFPLMRLADVYLMYAEAVLRGGGGGDAGLALQYVNAVRTRAFGGQTAGNITSDQLTLDFILDERARELFWEGYRRTDLIRFGRFSDSQYLWQWKGGVKDGMSTPSYRNLFPIPASDLSANYNLKQNTGY
jgi:hypothetical protein